MIKTKDNQTKALIAVNEATRKVLDAKKILNEAGVLNNYNTAGLSATEQFVEHSFTSLINRLNKELNEIEQWKLI